jgi:tetratricopeptide (TPR) repeat protein
MISKTEKIIFAIAVALTLLHGAAAAQSRAASARSYQARGDEFWAAGDYRRAIEDYSLALAFDEQDAALWNKRGLARERNGDVAGAMADFNRAVTLTLIAVLCARRKIGRRKR